MVKNKVKRKIFNEKKEIVILKGFVNELKKEVKINKIYVRGKH
jgi:hypothetical protein